MAYDTPDVTLEYITSLTFDQVNDYLARTDAEHPCEACTHDRWLIDSDEGKVLFVNAPLSHNPRNGLIFLPLTCERCGNTRFINAVNIAANITHHEAGHGKAE